MGQEVKTQLRWDGRILVEKLGIDATKRVCIAGKLDAELRADLEASGAKIAKTARGKDFDAIFFATTTKKDLERGPQLRAMLADTGALWIVHPRGKTGPEDPTKRAVLTAGRTLGLTDNKVIEASEDLDGPVRRPARAPQEEEIAV